MSGFPRAGRGLLGLGLALFGGGLACLESRESSSAAQRPPASDRYLRIRALLAQDPQSPERAEQLYPLTAPVCSKGPEREAFFETAAWSVEQSEGTDQLTKVLAVDVFEFVATACARTSLDGAWSLLDRARELIPDDPQLDVVSARLAAAHERFDVAAEAARRARDGGSEHAIALLANIQARIARERVGAGFEPGMFDEAIETVSIEPRGDWQAIDLTAVLSTRARLLIERALWQEGEPRKRTLLEARAAFTRLSRAPFVEAVRRSAHDHLCFDTPVLGAEPTFCRKAATEFGNLGGAAVAGLALEGLEKADADRAAGLRRFIRRVGELGPRATVVLAVRGDETELVDWARPATRILAALEAKEPTWVWVDRTSTARSTALVERILAEANVNPDVRVAPRNDALATPCVAALVADRRAPETCPLAETAQAALEAAPSVGLVVLVGRDLDAELDDFGLYGLPTHLLSFRLTNAKRKPEGWFKSLSDVWFVLEPPGR